MNDREILNKEEGRDAIKRLTDKGLISESRGIDFMLTPLGQTEAVKIWQKLEPDERMLLSISSRHFKTTHYL